MDQPAIGAIIARIMEIGVCTSTADSAILREAGYDFVEESTQRLLQGLVPDADWSGAQRASESVLPVLVANVLVPAALKITGPEADRSKLHDYIAKVTERAGRIGIRTLVFGSGAARNVPERFDPNRAQEQLVDFARDAAMLAGRHGVTIVAEPLNRGECNLINSVAEAMECVRAIGHPNFQCLVDSYHFWLEDEPLANLMATMPHVRHVHLADKVGRTPPGESGQSDYRPFFSVLKQGGYNGTFSIEAASFPDLPSAGPRVLAFIKEQWAAA